MLGIASGAMRVRSLSPGPKKVRGKNGPMVCGEVGGSGAFGRCGGTRRASVMAWPAWRRGRAARCHARNPASRCRLPRAAAPGHQAIARCRIGDRHQDPVQRVERVARKIHLGDQPRQRGGPQHREVDMRRAPPGIRHRHRIGPGLDGEEAVAAVVIRQHPAIADEIGVERRVARVDRVEVAAGGIGLPQFHHGAAYRPAVLIQHPAADMG